MDHELKGTERDELRDRMDADPAFAAETEEMRLLLKQVADEVPGSEEVPYGDFFNARVLRELEEDKIPEKTRSHGGLSWWRWLALPTLASVIAFSAGWVLKPTSSEPLGQSTKVEHDLFYLPLEEVQASVVSRTNGEVQLIVVEGLADIPDEEDLTVSVQKPDRPVG